MYCVNDMCNVHVHMQVGGLQNEIDVLRTDIQYLKQEVKKRDSIITSLKNDIDSLKKEIQERDDTIQDKVSGITYNVMC